MPVKSSSYTIRLETGGGTDRYNPPTNVKSSRSWVVTNTVSHDGPKKGWKDIILRHGNATTGLTGIRQSVEHTPGFVNVGIKNPITHPYRWKVWNHGFLLGGYPTLTIPSAYAVDISSSNSSAYSQALSRIRKRTADASGLTVLGELRETLRMIRRPAESLANGLTKYLAHVEQRYKSLKWSKRGKPKIKELNRIAADTWLEFAFGWRPLVSDLEDAAKALSKLGNKEHYSYFKESSNQQWETTGPSVSSTVSYPEIRVLMHSKLIYEAEVKYYGQVKVGAVTPDVSGIGNRLGFNPRAVLPTIWELIPGSFLVDYVINVGEVLEASCMSFEDVAWIAKGVKQRASRQVFGVLDVPRIKLQLGSAFDGATGNCGAILLTEERVARSVPPLVVPRFEFHAISSGRKLLNIAALITARSKSISSAIERRYTYYTK